MAVQGLPSADSLVGPIATLRRTLAIEEAGFRNSSFTATSTDTNVTATANGMVEALTVTIKQGAYPTVFSQANLTTLAASVKDACGKVLTNANNNTKPKASADAANYTLTGIPNLNQAPPATPNFQTSDADLTALLRAQDPIIAAKQFQGISGAVSAIVDGTLTLVSITLTTPMPQFQTILEQDIVIAINLALDKAKHLFEDGILNRVNTGLDSSAVTFPTACIWAQGNLALADRVQIKKQDGTFAPVVNAGSTGTNIGADAKTGDVWSRAAVEVRDRGTVNGNMRAMSTLTLRTNASVTGTTTQNGAFLQIPTLGLSVTFPSTTQPNRTVPDQNNVKTLDLQPGAYPDITVNDTGILILHTGTYFFNNVTVNSGGTISCVSSGGLVVVNVRTNFIFRGKINEQNKPTTRPKFFVGFFGTSAVPIEGPFTGTLMALTAPVTIATINQQPTAHSGAFYAKDITINPDNTITHFPFSGPPTPTST
jgi:DNA-binding protein YbaB